MSAAPAEPSPVRPQNPTELFVGFTVMALQGFGGVMVAAQRELVDVRRWMTNEEFVEDWAVAQIMPGPNVINMALMYGGRQFGVRGALAAMAGLLTIPLALVLLVAVVYSHYASHPGVAGALRGMGAVTAGLIMATGIKLIPAVKMNVLGRVLCIVFGATAFISLALLRLPLLYVLPSLGLVACTLAYQKLKP
ncbi:MAG TPA: chromate transporter [Usitatibacteraceae bacterium]